MKEEEAVEALRKLIQGEFPEVQVFAGLEGEYGDAMTLDIDVKQLMKDVYYSVDFVISKPKMSEEEFQKKAAKIERYIEDQEIYTSGAIYCFKEEVDSNMTADELLELVRNSFETNTLIKWVDYISTR